MGPYKTIQAAFNALLKGFKKQTKRDPNPIEEEMIMEEAKKKITAQGENISTLDTGIMTQASGTKKPIDIPVKKTEPDLDRPFVTEEEMSAFTLDDNAKKLNRAKGMIDELGAKNTRQKLFVADLVEDVGQGIYENVDMGAVIRSNMFDDLIEQGVNEDVLMKVMYSGTKSDDFATTMAKIKSNAQDEGIDINDTVDFYERSFFQVNRPNKADGGIMRTGFGLGTPKKIFKLFQNLKKSKKLNDDEYADFLDEIGGADQLEAYEFDGTVGDAQRIIKEQKQYMKDMELQYKKGNLDPEPGDKSPARKKFLEKKLEEMEMSGDKKIMTVDEIEELSSFDLGSEMDVAKTLAPKMVERLQLKKKYPGITDDLLDKILIDDNMQRKAEVLATIDEAFKMMEKGKGTDEILDTMKNVTRTKQASGGLPNILGV
jgi:predicted DNA-binding protein YlxM (UPF0122 family)